MSANARTRPSDAESPHALELDDATFALLQTLVLRETGTFLPLNKKAWLVGRVGRRLLDLHLTTFVEYYRLISSHGGASERAAFIDCVTTKESDLWREGGQLAFLQAEVLPRWVEQARQGERRKSIRGWCASGAGEEPYSMAMSLLAGVDKTWSVDVLATDVSPRALADAESGTWPTDRLASLPRQYFERFMLRGSGAQLSHMRVSTELRNAVRFAHRNIVAASMMDIGPFDLVSCRNVLNDLDIATRRAVLDRIVSRLSEGAYLFLGHAEPLPAGVAGLRRVAPDSYQCIDGSKPSARRIRR